jgi:hypothetical protein
MDDKARLYRDQILTRFDEVMGELITTREERDFLNHDIKDHEKRITKLEHS